jgi:hypothetical protein
MDEKTHRQIVDQQIERAIETMFPNGEGRVGRTLVERELHNVAQRAWTEGQAYVLLNLKMIEDVAETYHISTRRARALAAERHARFGIGWQVPGTKAWLFRPEEMASLAPGPEGYPKGRPRKSNAESIYLAHFGHLDDKRFHATKLQEIEDWLKDGDQSQPATLQGLIDEWGEYDSEEVERQKHA